MASMEAWLLSSGFLEELSTEWAVTEISDIKQITPPEIMFILLF